MKEIKNLEASKKVSEKELELVNGGDNGGDGETLEPGDPNKQPGSDGSNTIYGE